MAQFSHVYIIFNPNSTGDAKKQAHDLKRDLAKSSPQLPVTLLPTSHAGHAVELAYETARDAKKGQHPLIISASGDGGYNEVVNGALKAQAEGAQPICAVLPSGNANDHARTVQDRPLAKTIAMGKVRRLDVLQLTTTQPGKTSSSRYAHSYIGLGLTPAVAVELNKHDLNSFRESLIVLKTFWSLRPIVIRRGGTTERDASLICSTIPEMAKVLTLSTTAKPDDGRYEVTTLPHKRKLTLLLLLFRGVVSGLDADSRHDDYICTVLKATPVQLDGEIIELPADTELQISLQPGLLRSVA